MSSISQPLSFGAPIIKGYQDIALYAPFHYADACQTGVLLRAEKTADGTTGIDVSLAGGDVGAYDVLLDAQGKETSRTSGVRG